MVIYLTSAEQRRLVTGAYKFLKLCPRHINSFSRDDKTEIEIHISEILHLRVRDEDVKAVWVGLGVGVVVHLRVQHDLQPVAQPAEHRRPVPHHCLAPGSRVRRIYNFFFIRFEANLSQYGSCSL